MTIADRAVRLACARVLGVNLEESRIERWTVRPAMADDLRKIMARDPAVQAMVLRAIAHRIPEDVDVEMEILAYASAIEKGTVTLEIDP